MEKREIKKKAYGYFESGFHCAEVIAKTVLETFSGGASPETIRAASGLGGGIGGSTEELCGAFTGGVVALGALLGRANPAESLTDCGLLIKKFKKEFLEKAGSLNCHTIMDNSNDPLGCVKLTAEATAILTDLLNQFGLESEIDLTAFSSQPRAKVALGQCAFKARS